MGNPAPPAGLVSGPSVLRLSVVYGSLSTAVIALFSMELAATPVLLGAQVIAEYEHENHRIDAITSC